MPRMFLARSTRNLLAIPGCLVLVGLVACHKGSSDSSLYVFDGDGGGTPTVQIWNDISKVYSDATASTPTNPAADRTITGAYISSAVTANAPLAWGGMVLDSNANVLYLVNEAGLVTVISEANTQNGDISNSTTVGTFQLGQASELLTDSVFSQAAVDSSRNVLYVMETTSNYATARVWCVPNASRQASINGTVTPASQYTTSVSGDTAGVGLATAPGGDFFGFFAGGTALDDLTHSYTGARIRMGTSDAFPAPIIDSAPSTDVLIGSNTTFPASPNYGSLAYDTQNNALYVFAQPSAAFVSPATDTASILVFNQNQFSPGFNVAPARTLTGVPTSLRIISHALNADWMVGAEYAPTADTGTDTAVSMEGSGTGTLLIWQSPSKGGTPASPSLTGVKEIRGIALGGN